MPWPQNVTCSTENVKCHTSHNEVLRGRTVSSASSLPCTEGKLAFQKSSLSSFSFQVTLCSNTVQKYELALVVDVEGIGEEVLALLMTARYPTRLLPSLPVSPKLPIKGYLSRRQQVHTLPWQPGHTVRSAFLGREAEPDTQMTKL